MNNCNACNLCVSRFNQIETVGNCEPSECELLLVGDYPKQEDDGTGKPFSGPKYQFLWDLLAQIGVKYQVTYLIKCIPVDARTRRYMKPGASEYQTCMHNVFYQEIQYLRPKCILLLGQAALEAFTGESDLNLGDYREKAHYWKSTGIKYLATYTPGYAVDSENDMFYGRFIEDVVYACRHAMQYRSEGKYRTITISFNILIYSIKFKTESFHILYSCFQCLAMSTSPKYYFISFFS